ISIMTDISRRTLLKASPLLGAAASAQTQQPHSPQNANRPNIVWIISDQFRADNLGCLGMNPLGLTPNLDAMPREGTLFRAAVCNQPVCAPTRACMFTGQYAEKHGVWRNGIALN